MKKVLALIISLALVLSCLPGAAVAEKYKSNLLKKTLKLPSKMALVDEQKLEDGSVQLAIAIETQPDAMIYTTVKKVKEFKGYTMSTLPDEQLNAWTEYYYQYYPENASAGRLPSSSGAGDTLYCYCGQNAEGGSILVYASVKDKIFVSSYCVAAGGFSKATMQGALEALNAVNAAFGKSASASGGTTVKPALFSAAPSAFVSYWFTLQPSVTNAAFISVPFFTHRQILNYYSLSRRVFQAFFCHAPP